MALLDFDLIYKAPTYKSKKPYFSLKPPPFKTTLVLLMVILEGKFIRKGISPPEYLGEHFDYVNEYMKNRNVIYKVKKI